ncbi:MAG TPA: hypothetical protein DCP51_03340 [Clostridiales bacterium]|nr:MAG: hypothetical protein A2Y40_06370 [Candidatus Margulisbacteria bacterium GWF2_35_9]HAN20699.1 hypothetical protein [Clostridiales bacterium]
MLFKKSIIFLLAVLLFLVSFLVSCDGNPSNKNTVSDSSNLINSGDAGFPYDDNFDGQTIRIFCVNTARHVYGELQFVPNEEATTSSVSEAVKIRNDYIEEHYGLNIEVTSAAYPSEEVKELITAGACDYDIVVDSVDKMVTSVTDNYYWSLDNIIDLDNPWWDQSSINSLTLNDKHYFVAGDALITDDDNIYLTLFNKKIYNENSELQNKYGNIYDLVRDGKFTYDVFLEMSKLVSHTDQNGQWGFYATYGNLSHSYGSTIMVNGAGVALAEKMDDGSVKLNPGTENAVNVFDKVYEIMSDKTVTQRAELIIGQGSATSKYGFTELQAMFEAGRGLFYNTTSSSITRLKNSPAILDFQFGVLPIPKFNEEQDKYYCSVNRYQSSVIGIPTTNIDNKEATAFLLEALGYFSDDVTEAYFETTLKLQAIEDDEDAKMLDLIYNNRFYDIGAIYNWGSSVNPSLVGLYSSVIGDDSTNTLTSKWESIKDAVETDMLNTIDEYKNNLT